MCASPLAVRAGVAGSAGCSQVRAAAHRIQLLGRLGAQAGDQSQKRGLSECAYDGHSSPCVAGPLIEICVEASLTCCSQCNTISIVTALAIHLVDSSVLQASLTLSLHFTQPHCIAALFNHNVQSHSTAALLKEPYCTTGSHE